MLYGVRSAGEHRTGDVRVRFHAALLCEAATAVRRRSRAGPQDSSDSRPRLRAIRRDRLRNSAAIGGSRRIFGLRFPDDGCPAGRQKYRELRDRTAVKSRQRVVGRICQLLAKTASNDSDSHETKLVESLCGVNLVVRGRVPSTHDTGDRWSLDDSTPRPPGIVGLAARLAFDDASLQRHTLVHREGLGIA